VFRLLQKGQELKFERGVTAKETQSHLEETIDLHPFKASGMPSESRLGSPQQVRKKIRSNSLQDEQLFVGKVGSQLGKC